MIELDLGWEPELHYRRGAPINLDDIHVFHDFDWLEVFPDNRAQFRNGKCLAQHVRDECPEDKTPALLLTTQDRDEQSVTTEAFHVVIVNIHKYLELATPMPLFLTSPAARAQESPGSISCAGWSRPRRTSTPSSI